MPPIPSLATSSGRNFTAYLAGDIVEGDAHRADSYALNSATLDFGILVVQDTNQGQCKVMAADTDQQLGISVRVPLQPASTDGNNTVTYKQGDMVAVMRDGIIACKAVEAVRRNDQVLAITAQGGALGGSKGGVAGAGRVDVIGAKWLDDVAANEVGRVLIQSVGTRRTTT